MFSKLTANLLNAANDITHRIQHQLVVQAMDQNPGEVAGSVDDNVRGATAATAADEAQAINQGTGTHGNGQVYPVERRAR